MTWKIAPLYTVDPSDEEAGSEREAETETQKSYGFIIESVQVCNRFKYVSVFNSSVP